MPAFVIVNFDVLDECRQEALVPRFKDALGAAGGRIIAFGHVVEQLEGEIEPYPRVAVFEFPTLGAAKTFYKSDAYAPLLAERREIQRVRMFIAVQPE